MQFSSVFCCYERFWTYLEKNPNLKQLSKQFISTAKILET